MKNQNIIVRPATREDVPSIVHLLWNDEQGASRETVSASSAPLYLEAFSEIQADTASQVLVAVDGQQVVGCVQMTLIPGLSYQGSRRCLIEDLRVDPDYQGRGLGRLLMAELEQRAKRQGCRLIELFVHSDRAGAHAFYERCGFVGAHKGYRKVIDS